MEQQLERFLHCLDEKRHYSQNTISAYRNDLTQFIDFLRARAGHIAAWNDLDAAIVNDYVNALQAREYAPSTVARKVAALKSFFHFLRQEGILRANISGQLNAPKVEKRLPKTLSAQDVARLLAAPTHADGPKALRDRALLELLYASGMRVTELVSMQVDDIDLQQGTVTCPGKGGQGRVIPIQAPALDGLAQYMAAGRPHLAKGSDERALFLNHRGQRLTRQGLWLIIKAYAEEVNLADRVTPHVLRHSFAAHKLEEGADIRQLQRLLGHANVSTTQIYTQVSAKDGEPGG